VRHLAVAMSAPRDRFLRGYPVKLLTQAEAASRSETGHESAPASPPNPLADEVANDLVRLFKLLSDATPAANSLLSDASRGVPRSRVLRSAPQSQPAVSHHLGLLRSAGLIKARREGKHNFYRLHPDGFHQLLDVIFGSIPKAIAGFDSKNTCSAIRRRRDAMARPPCLS